MFPSIKDVRRNVDTFSHIQRDSLFGRQLDNYKLAWTSILQHEIAACSDKSKPYTFLSSDQLGKVNAKDGVGVIYDLLKYLPFKDKYYNCKAVSIENIKGSYICLYYFYNTQSNKEITNLILSQLGLAKFRWSFTGLCSIHTFKKVRRVTNWFPTTYTTTVRSCSGACRKKMDRFCFILHSAYPAHQAWISLAVFFNRLIVPI